MPADSLRGQLQSSLVGRYEIERELGRGGMATVYLARDVKHQRRVALKVLDPELGAVLGVGRFLSEIQVTANLQHPNLLPLFDSGDADGLLYYVMPYIDGESLRAKLTREKQLPIDEAIQLATAVASALDYAHRHGVIHRDLKPENILLHEGQPLVADFGIALAVSNAGGDRITQTGLSLGTPQYMSPEQATGDRVIDARTDVYSLGAVTYEMLTGEAPHTGTTAQAIIARLLTDLARSIRSTRASVPAHVEGAVMRALEKLPADRWHTAHEFADALAGRGGAVTLPGGARDAGSTPPSAASPGRSSRRRALMIAGGFVVAIALAVAITWRLAAPRSARSLTFVIDAPEENGVPQTIYDFAVSPDGETIALAAGNDVEGRAYLRRLAEPNASPVPGTRNAIRMAYSPNGKWLAIVTSDGTLLKVRVDSAAPAMTLATGIEYYSGVSWADDETVLLGSDRPLRSGLGRIAATGGRIRPLTATSAMLAHGFPFVAPDRKTVLFTNWGPGFVEDDSLAIGSLETGAFKSTSLLAYRPIGVVDGRILYTFGTSVMAVPFDAKQLHVTGEPIRVLENITMGDHAAAYSLSGTLAYTRGQPTSRLILLDRDGRVQELSGDERSFSFTGSRGRFSPDGQRIALDSWAPSGDTAASDIFVFDVKSRTLARMTSLGNVVEPAWTPDGKRLVFTTWFPRDAALWMQPADGSQRPEKVYQAPNGVAVYNATATPDGRGIVFCQGARFNTSTPNGALYYLAFAGEPKPERIVDEPTGFSCEGSVSPDGKWLAYVVSEGDATVYVRPFRRPGGRVRMSELDGTQPTWSRDGKRLFYATRRRENDKSWVEAVTVRSSGNSLDVVGRERVVALSRAGLFDMTPDGTRALAIRPSDRRVQLIVTTNWLPQLRARLAGRQ